MKNIKTIIVLITLFSINVTAQSLIDHTYSTTDGPDKNPLKGWNSGWWDNYDLATVGFQYLKWNEFEPTDGNFDFSYVENIINRPGSAGKHIILRLYTDWFGNNQTSDAGPQWLYTDYGVERFQASNGKYITNYNHPNYISQVTEAINALASQYDNDPRVYVIQLGVLGYWGEWHTHTYDNSFDIADATMNQILSVYTASFQNKKTMGRYPWKQPLASTVNIGYHNDFFKPFDGHSDEFDVAIDNGNKWLQGPVGGEIPPIDNSNQFMADLYETNEGMSMIETGHYSTMKVGSNERPCASDPNGQKCAGFMAMHRKMGYNFQITSALFAETISQFSNLVVDLNVTNIGVAPMYYDWDVQFALLDNTNQPVEIFEAPFDLTTIMADASVYSISMSNALNNVSEGDYVLATRIIQPEADQTKSASWQLDARNTYIVFSNDLPVINGSWDASNRLIGGWSILGNVTVDNNALSLNTDSLIANSVKIYPNPSEKELNIVKNGTIDLNNMEIYDMTGRLTKTISLENIVDKKSIDISNLASGVYNVIIHSENYQIRKRFVKK